MHVFLLQFGILLVSHVRDNGLNDATQMPSQCVTGDERQTSESFDIHRRLDQMRHQVGQNDARFQLHDALESIEGKVVAGSRSAVAVGRLAVLFQIGVHGIQQVGQDFIESLCADARVKVLECFSRRLTNFDQRIEQSTFDGGNNRA